MSRRAKIIIGTGLFSFGMLLVFFIVARNDIRTYKQYFANGTTTGTILEKSKRYSGRKVQARIYHVQYTFRSSDGVERIHRDSRIKPVLWHDFSKGGRIKIGYDPATNTSKVYPKNIDTLNALFYIKLAVWALIFMSPFIYMVWYQYLGYKKVKRRELHGGLFYIACAITVFTLLPIATHVIHIPSLEKIINGKITVLFQLGDICLGVVGLVWIFLALFSIFYALKSNKEKRRLHTHGQSLFAEICALENPGLGGVHLNYRFTYNETVYCSKRPVVCIWSIDLLNKEKKIKVYFDECNPSINTWELR